jgi:hypothetical protein
MQKQLHFKKLILDSIMLCSLLLLTSHTAIAQNINFTIDTAVDTGTLITETIIVGPDTYVLTINHQQDVEELDDLGGGDLVFYLGSGNALTPFTLNITRTGIPAAFNLNSIDYDTLGTGEISLTNENGATISAFTNYALGSGTLTITNSANAQNISQVNIIPFENYNLNDFGFHNINVDMVSTLGLNEAVLLEDSISIVPNPSNGNVTIKNAGINLQKAFVTDLNGRVVVSYDFEDITGNQDLEMNSKLSAGMYIMTILSDKAQVTKKLVIE